MEDLTKLPNIGDNLAHQLAEVGISTSEELKQLGSKEAWLRIKNIDSSACINRLYALEGAIENIPKKLLNDDIKTDLKEFYNCYK